MNVKSKRFKWGLIIVGLLILLVPFAIYFNWPFQTNGEETTNSEPEGAIELSGDIGDYNSEEGIDDPAHDPSIFKDGDTHYVVSTGIARDTDNPGGIFIRQSKGGLEGPWESVGEIPTPEWTEEYDVAHLWAPHVVENNGTFYMYYAVSIFGTNSSSIGVARTETPGDINSWEDLGAILTSDSSVDYNAIDPMVFEDKGKWWVVFGSHFSGIKLQALTDMTEPTGEIYTIANRRQTTDHNAIEGPTIFKEDDYYYLLTSWDSCCQGTDSTYKVAVGRSESLTGPYVDKDGTPLNEGGGEVILQSYSNHTGPGGQDIIKEDGDIVMVYHYYDANDDGVIRMQLREFQWEDGWPSF
ncbi:arabinan endo-1,5-alpha-L-arabinosidase [Aquibacillus rhizosphaerae]|uniref:Endo-alpha-(1->5)-L-arabinanase n=1 Tax=Aquibacillus rhizosphaerae TaxID=3051431 RepID=A0ABT7LDK0_9BACI|nr:arabinan endo-1,5-alpha-L-arabinosidase [Aquibacillus sp. LR5S19]MDL4842680.1 arabinan endo-1,5-alpha-L-arabinosidase [Aquibacillus sp. LR5S19]